MHHGVVEGEPGIFPDPVARLLRWVGGLFSRRTPRSGDRQGRQTDGQEPEAGGPPAADDAPE